jgi:hypothetical protein
VYDVIGNDTIIESLKASFQSFNHISCAVELNEIRDILQWHHDLNIYSETQWCQDQWHNQCRHSKEDECGCSTDLVSKLVLLKLLFAFPI